MKAPRIGEVWEGQGGVYAGIVRGRDGAPDAHLVVGPEADKAVNWKVADQFARAVTVNGLTDFSLPTRAEQSIAFGNVPELFQKDWYWSSEKTASDAGYAWCQTFGTGGQYCDPIDSELRARAVRRLTV